MLYSTEKGKARECIAIWKAVIQKINNKVIGEEKLQIQAAKWNISINEFEIIESAKENLQVAKE